MPRGHAERRADERRRGREDHVRAVADGLLHDLLACLAGNGVEIGARFDLLGKYGVQIRPAGFMGLRPCAALRVALMHKRNFQVLRARSKQGVARRVAHLAGRRLRADCDGIWMRQRIDIRLEQPNRIFQRVRVHLTNRRERMVAQEHQQSVRRTQPAQEHLPAQRLFKAEEARKEGLAVRRRPRLLRAFELYQQLPVGAGSGKLHLIQPRDAEKLQKLLIKRIARRIRIRGHQPRHIGRDRRRLKIAQNADALVALLHIEFSIIFKAADRFADALLPQMGVAEIDPFAAELRVGIQQRQKAGRERILPPGRLGSDDQVDGDLHQADALLLRGIAVGENLVEHLHIGRNAGGHAVLVLPESRFQRFRICGNRRIGVHNDASISIRPAAPDGHFRYTLECQPDPSVRLHRAVRQKAVSPADGGHGLHLRRHIQKIVLEEIGVLPVHGGLDLVEAV